jgi:hypothetical protein
VSWIVVLPHDQPVPLLLAALVACLAALLLLEPARRRSEREARLQHPAVAFRGGGRGPAGLGVVDVPRRRRIHGRACTTRARGPIIDGTRHDRECVPVGSAAAPRRGREG